MDGMGQYISGRVAVLWSVSTADQYTNLGSVSEIYLKMTAIGSQYLVEYCFQNTLRHPLEAWTYFAYLLHMFCDFS